ELLPLSNLYAGNPISPMRSKNRDLEKMATGHAFHFTKATDWFLQVAVEKNGVPCYAALQPPAGKHRDYYPHHHPRRLRSETEANGGCPLRLMSGRACSWSPRQPHYSQQPARSPSRAFGRNRRGPAALWSGGARYRFLRAPRALKSMSDSFEEDPFAPARIS